MTEPAQPVAKARPKRRWLRRTLKILGVLVLLGAIFHRPLFHAGARFALIQVASRQNLTLDVHFSGTIFTNLTVAGVRALPNGKAPSPVRKIEIERVRLDYSLWALIRKGVGEFLHSYEIKNAFLDIEAKPSSSEKEKKQKRALAQDLNNLLGQPALYADKVNIENFNITVTAETNVTKVEGFHLFAHPEQPGHLRIARLQVPAMPLWENLEAQTSYVNRNLFIKGLRLDEQLLIDELNFDASQRAQDKGSTALKAHLFGGTLTTSLTGSQLKKKGENLAQSYDTKLTLEAADISIAAATAYFGVKNVPVAQLERLSLIFTGEPEKPRTWSGTFGVRGSAVAVGGVKVDAVEVAARFEKGQAELTSATVGFGKNLVKLTGSATLPESVNEFATTEADARLELNAPDLAAIPKLPLALTGGLIRGGGPISWHGRQLATELELTAENIAGQDLSLARAQLGIVFRGELQKPRTWSGNLGVEVETFAAFGGKLDAVEFAVKLADGRAELTAGKIVAGANNVSLTAKSALPETIKDFAASELEAQLAVAAPNLAELTAMLPEPLSGTLDGGGAVALRDRKLTTDLNFAAENIANAKLGVGAARVKLKGTKVLDPASKNILDQLDGHIDAELSALRFQQLTIDSARLEAASDDQLITVQTLEVRRAENSLTAQGSYRLPIKEQSGSAALDGKFSIDAPKLESFGLAVKEKVLGGRLAGSGEIRSAGQAMTGGIKIEGSNFVLGGFKVAAVAARVNVAENTATIEELALKFNQVDQLSLTGRAGVQAPFPYEAALHAGVRNLAIFQPLLEIFGNQSPLAGALKIDWSGKGEPAPPMTGDPLAEPALGPPAPRSALANLHHDGELSFALTKGRFAKLDLSEVKLAGLYGLGFAESTEFRFVTGATSLAGGLELREGKFKLKDLNLAQAGTTVLTGYLFVPVNLQNLGRPIALDQRIAANVNANKLDIEKLLTSFGQTAPMSGTITAHLLAGGTPLKPFGHLKATASALRTKAAAKLAAAELELDLHYANNDLTLNAALKQPQIQPLTIKGHVPVDLGATLQGGKLDPNLPIDLAVKLPPSSLAFLPTLAPQVRRATGTAGIDARIAGTVGTPILSGSAAIDLKESRLANDNLPGISAFLAKLTFANDTLTLDTFRGGIGGGTFKVEGAIKLPKLTEPVLNLRLLSDEVLVKRDDAITVRLDTDVKVAGPLKAAAVTGVVKVVHSRFFKEIDILPVALPGRPKPAPKAVQEEKTVSIPALAEWKFDVAIKTDANDPFRIQGNLANGGAHLDLKLGGTGLAPWLEGTLRIADFTATLPFSRLTITRGLIYFGQDAPFEPSLDLQAESQLRDYLVRAYIYGKANDPQVQLSSEPPLAHADIVSLLATGTTTAELAGSADVLASKAAVLAVQQLYRKVFKRGAPQPQEEKRRTGAGELMDRFDFELGAVDARTGQQAAAGRFKVTDNIHVVGNVNVAGEFTGTLKYLIRFR